MGLRGTLRKTFGSSSKKSNSTSSSSSKKKSSPFSNEIHYTDRTDIEYYKPNEIPKSKYRGKVDPLHHASLQAFSFTDAFASAKRRSSVALSGTFSPGGTKSQSRVASRVHSRRPSVVEGSHLKTTTGIEPESDGDESADREQSEVSNTSTSTGATNSDTASTSLSGPTTATTTTTTAVASTPMTVLTSPSNSKLSQQDSGVEMSDSLSKHQSIHDSPFTPEELELAMTRATLRSREAEAQVVQVS